MGRLLPVLCALCLAVATAGVARADLDPGSSAWNGTNRFAQIVREESGGLRNPRTLDLGTLTSADALVLLGPEAPLPVDDLVRFVRRGGQLVVADDFGSSEPLLARFGVGRRPVDAARAPRVRDEPALLVAVRTGSHPLADGVPALLTNRPAAWVHPRLSPVFTVGDDPLVLVGLVDAGRVVALADPSVFTNAMMQLGGNRRFAANLVRFVAEGEPRRVVYVVDPDTRFVGHFEGGRTGTGRERVEDILRRIARTRLPEPALRVLAACLAAVSLLLVSGLLARRPVPRLPWLAPGVRHDDHDARARIAAAEALAALGARRPPRSRRRAPTLAELRSNAAAIGRTLGRARTGAPPTP